MRTLLSVLVLLFCINSNGQLPSDYLSFVDKYYPIENLPYYGCYGTKQRLQSSFPEDVTMNCDMFYSYDMKKKESKSVRAAINVHFSLVSSYSTYLCFAFEMLGGYCSDYLINVDSKGNIIDKLLVRVGMSEFRVEPMQYMIKANKEIVVRQAEVVSVENSKKEHYDYTPQSFTIKYVDKTYTVNAQGKFCLKNTISYSTQKKTWKDVEKKFNIIKEDLFSPTTLPKSNSGLKQSVR